MLVGGCLTVIYGLLELFVRIRGIQPIEIPDLNKALIMFPAMIMWGPVSLILSNCVLYIVPPLNAIATKYASEAKRPGFADSQKRLGKVALYIMVVCVPLITLGFIV